jgi:hypothetical protein
MGIEAEMQWKKWLIVKVEFMISPYGISNYVNRIGMCT